MQVKMLPFSCGGSPNSFLARTACPVSVLVALLILIPLGCSRESARSDLLQLQNRSGLRLVAVRDSKVFTVSFADGRTDQSKPFVSKGTAANGTVSPDGTRVAISLCPDPGTTHPTPYRSECAAGLVLAVVRADGSDLKQYSDFANPGLGFCWSHDMSELVLSMEDRRKGRRFAGLNLQIVDLNTGDTELIDDGSVAYVDSQCWSPDDKHLVYWIDKPLGVEIVRMYDTQTKKSRDIASGGHPTWSPDGKWIAFLYCPPSLSNCKYYGTETSTNEQKILFKTDGETGLSWSPDSRFVAYVNGATFFERSPSEYLREMRRLRIRRLDDNAEDSFADFFDGDIMWFDWVTRIAPD